MSSIIQSKKKSCRILVDDQQQVARKYRHFKVFLEHNRECLQLISALESRYYRGEGFDLTEIKALLDRLKTETAALVESLNELSNGRHPELAQLPELLLAEAITRAEPKREPLQGPFTVPLRGLLSQSPPAVGSIGASLTPRRRASSRRSAGRGSSRPPANAASMRCRMRRSCQRL